LGMMSRRTGAGISRRKWGNDPKRKARLSGGLAGQSHEREVCPSHDSMSSRRRRISRRSTKRKTARLYIRGRPSRWRQMRRLKRC
jgi:hypothetical protein